jgi:predicted NBD/HSP70 family sugar kinase
MKPALTKCDDEATILGIDIGGTSVKAVVRSGGRWIRGGQSIFYARPDAQQLRLAIRQATGAVQDADMIGLCVPGLMDATRSHVTLAVNVPGLVGLPLTRLVPDALGWLGARSTIILNDAAAAAHDIYAARHLTGRLLLLTLGTGVGSVVLDDGGKALDVEGGSSGHLGQIDVSIPGHEVIGPDGGAGGLEGYIGVAALRRVYGPDISQALDGFSGNEPAMLALVRALRIAHAIYRPSHICLCGGLGFRLKRLLPILKSMIDHQLTSLARPGYTFTSGDDDFHAARGAAMLAQNSLVAAGHQ